MTTITYKTFESKIMIRYFIYFVFLFLVSKRYIIDLPCFEVFIERLYNSTFMQRQVANLFFS